MYRKITAEHLQYALIRLIAFPLRFLPLRSIHALGNGLGAILYYTMPSFRKRTLSNLALATTLTLSPKELKRTARRSIGNLCITCLEYPKFAALKNINRYVSCENPATAEAIVRSGQGLIFFCAHQANWELLFLEGSARMPGAAIARPLKNRYLNAWVNGIRERFGGTIIMQKKAIREGLRALKHKKFLGIVGDQGMPESDFSSLFFGRRAYTSPSAALLAYKAQAPLITATIRRSRGKYIIRYGEPNYPSQKQSRSAEVSRLMHTALSEIEASIHQCPEQWLWLHNRWKQDPPKHTYNRFRSESILVIAGPKIPARDLRVFRTIYPRAFLSFWAHTNHEEELRSFADEVSSYDTVPEFIPDYRFKLVFDLYGKKRFDRFTSLSAFEVLRLSDLYKLASEKPPHPLPSLITKALCHKRSHLCQ